MMKAVYLLITFAVIFPSRSFPEESTFDLLTKGKNCKESSNQQIECNYKIGEDFWLSIPGIGLTDSAITLMKSDFYGSYYASYGLGHGCVIVKPGSKNRSLIRPNMAFVSPVNGKVYKDWESCKSGF
jgi:hypothetical protein